MRVLAAIVLLGVAGCAHDLSAIDTEMRIEIICPQDAPGPRSIAPGESISKGLPGLDSERQPLLEPGRYRIPFTVERPSGGSNQYYSPEFQVSDAANTQPLRPTGQ